MSQLSCKYGCKAVIQEDYKTGDMICSECGLVIQEQLVGNLEPVKLVDILCGDSGIDLWNENLLLTGIDNSARLGSRAFDEDSGKLKYVYKSHLSKRQQSLISAFEDINDLSKIINVPQNVAYYGKVLFKKLHEKQKVIRSHNVCAASSLFIACRHEKVPRTYKEMSLASKLPKTKLVNCCLKIIEFLNLPNPPTKAQDIIPRFIAELGFPFKIEKKAKMIAKVAYEVGLSASYDVIGAASIYIAAKTLNFKITQREVASIACVSIKSVSILSKLLEQNLRR